MKIKVEPLITIDGFLVTSPNFSKYIFGFFRAEKRIERAIKKLTYYESLLREEDK
jgi:hypothetical protein